MSWPTREDSTTNKENGDPVDQLITPMKDMEGFARFILGFEGNMPYINTTVKQLFNSTLNTWVPLAAPSPRMYAAVEAGNTELVWARVTEWFYLMETGEADLHMPDLFWLPRPGAEFEELTQEIADSLVEEIDLDFQLEAGRMKTQGKQEPDFKRLSPPARMAFAQEIYDLLLTQSEMEVKAEALIEEGYTAETYLAEIMETSNGPTATS